MKNNTNLNETGKTVHEKEQVVVLCHNYIIIYV